MSEYKISLEFLIKRKVRKNVLESRADIFLDFDVFLECKISIIERKFILSQWCSNLLTPSKTNALFEALNEP